MQGYNVILVYSPDETRLLLCHRRKDPYRGLSNLVGGHIEPGEDGLAAAYRELGEETAIGRADITLTHLMDFTYPLADCRVEAYAGRLKHEVAVRGDENELYWSPVDRDFFDQTEFAGEGNIGHMVEQVKLYRGQLFGD